MSLCCATLQWLLVQNAAVDAVRAQALTSVQAVAPDGSEIRLIVHEASRVTLLSPGKPPHWFGGLGCPVWAGVRQGHGHHLVLEQVPHEQVLPQRGTDAVGQWPVLEGSCRWAEISFAREGGGAASLELARGPSCAAGGGGRPVPSGACPGCGDPGGELVAGQHVQGPPRCRRAHAGASVLGDTLGVWGSLMGVAGQSPSPLCLQAHVSYR